MTISILTAALLLATVPADHEVMPVPLLPAPVTISAPAPVPPQGIDPADIIVTGRTPPPREDPLQGVNKQSFAAIQAVDGAVVGPVALAYEKAVPSPVRSGVRNFLANLHEPETCLNFVLQHKIGKALQTVGRFALNSTIGAAGLFDFAARRPFRLKKHYNGFANTLGFYGVKPGPFLFLPIVGATTVRDLFGYAVDKTLLPFGVGKPFTQTTYTLPTGVLSALDHRNETAAQIAKINDGATSPYVALRAAYLQRRQAEIDELHGKPSVPLNRER
jgi:phospholipid-binding lipoprotein MlaA